MATLRRFQTLIEVAFAFTVTDGRVVEIHVHADPERLDPSVLEMLDT